MSAAQDDDALADAPVALAHVASGGDYAGAPEAVVQVTIVEDDVTTLAVTGARAVEGAGTLRFAVSLSLANDAEVTVDYASGTTGDTATAAADYAAARGKLVFARGSTAAQVIEVTVADDALDEPDEELTVTLSNPRHAVLAGGGDTAVATGTIEDDDAPPELRIAPGSLSEGADERLMRFAVNLERASGHTVTVRYETADGTATAGADYEAESGTLTFGAGSTQHTVAVQIVDDQVSEEMETFTVTLSDPERATLSETTATGTIADDEPPKLSSLQVTGGGTVYPAFDADIHHYALTCSNATTLQVTAAAKRSGARLTLLRDDSDNNHSAFGALDVQVAVNRNHDVAIELSDGGDAVTYVIHCLPSGFPDIRVLKKTAGVSDGLMLVTPRYGGNNVRFSAVIDNNGVPRFHRESGFNFRFFSDGPTIDGEQVRYSVGMVYRDIDLLNRDFEVIRTLRKDVAGTWIDAHDFLFTDDGDYLLNVRARVTRDLSERHDILDSNDNPYGIVNLTDSVLQVITPAGTQKFYWNSWEHLTIDPDCRLRAFPGQYAHLNAFQIVDGGDIVASFRGCSQVLRIDGTTGAVKWKLGGTEDTPDTNTEYLDIVGDDEGEFCGQHHVTLTEWDSVVLFDNGVTVLGRNRWLIAWGRPAGITANLDEVPSIVEVDPSNGTTYLEIHMSKSGELAFSYRVYRVPESDVTIPLNLP